jgi:hypothetical protein
MKKLITLILSFVAAIGIAVAQDYSDAYERQKGITRIIERTLCSTCKEKEHILTYIFDQNGFNIETHSFFNGAKIGIARYFWNKEGALQSTQHYRSTKGNGSALPSRSKAQNADKNTTPSWDTTKISEEVRRTYAGPRLDKITWMEGQAQNVSHVINFYYDNNGKVAREEHIALPQSTHYHRTFRYAGDSIFIEYFKKDVPTGKGKKKINKAGKPLYEATYNTAGVRMYECKNRYNPAGRILEQNIVETDIDGYGERVAQAGYDKITYRYDQLGKLAIVDKYVKGKVSVTDFYEYALATGK